jgi:hypothetical protein
MSFPRKLFFKAIAAIILIGIVLLIIIGVSGYFALSDIAKYGSILLIFIGFFLYPLMYKVTDFIDAKVMGPFVDEKIEKARRAKLGFTGEDTVFGWLKEIANPENILRNISLRDSFGNTFDIDLMVIDERGIIVLEVKNFSNSVHFENDDYFYENKEGKKSLSLIEDPRSEARRHAEFLRNYLNNKNLNYLKINTAVVFPNGKVSWDGNSGVYIIKDKESLRNYIGGLEIDSASTLQVCDKIKSLLRKNK